MTINNMFNTTRQKRPDRVIKFGAYKLNSDNDLLYVWNMDTCFTFPLSEIPNLIKALQEVVK